MVYSIGELQISEKSLNLFLYINMIQLVFLNKNTTTNFILFITALRKEIFIKSGIPLLRIFRGARHDKYTYIF